MAKPKLTIDSLQKEAEIFAKSESVHEESQLYGITDGKAVGTYLEHKLQGYLQTKYDYVVGSSAKGIDFPELLVDIKVTSIKQPQSSCPFKSARQKIFGLEYSLLIFVYEKIDDHENKTGRLDIKHTIFVESHRTANFQMTSSLNKIVKNNGNLDDIMACLYDSFLPIDDIQATSLAKEILSSTPKIGYLTLPTELLWRTQYSRVIQEAGKVDGINRIV